MTNRWFKYIYFYLYYHLYAKQYMKKIEDKHLLTVLNLHRISDEENPFYPSLSCKQFDDLLEFVTTHFNVITFEKINLYEKSEKPNLILSFDDGFHDFLDNAVPIMEKYGIKANLNIIPECVESGLPVWDVQLGDFLNQAPVEMVNELPFPGFHMKLTPSNKSRYGLLLTRYLKQRPHSEREKLWAGIQSCMDNIDIQYTKMLNRNEIADIAANSFEIGVHSFSHESMGIESDQFFKEDFAKCVDYFDNTLHLPLNIYAFPNGSYQKWQIEYLQKQGISHILLVEEEYSTYNTNIHKRFTFYADSKWELYMRALGYKHPFFNMVKYDV